MTDPRAVRVRLAIASSTDGDRPMVVAALDAAALDVVGPGVLAQRHVTVDGAALAASLASLDGSRHRLLQDEEVTTVILEPVLAGPQGTRLREVLVDGFRFLVEAEPEQRAALRERATRGGSAAGHAGPLEVRAVIPGRVVSVAVAPGDAIATGGQLLVVEAMKMQNELRSPRDGTIVRVGAVAGGTVEIGDLLVVIE